MYVYCSTMVLLNANSLAKTLSDNFHRKNAQIKLILDFRQDSPSKNVFKERSLTKCRFPLLPGEQANTAQASGIALGVYKGTSSPTHPFFGWADRGNTCADPRCPWRSAAKVTLTFSTSALAIDLEWKLVHVFILCKSSSRGVKDVCLQ